MLSPCECGFSGSLGQRNATLYSNRGSAIGPMAVKEAEMEVFSEVKSDKEPAGSPKSEVVDVDGWIGDDGQRREIVNTRRISPQKNWNMNIHCIPYQNKIFSNLEKLIDFYETR